MKKFVVDQLKGSLEGKKILYGISGSIAAFKACETIRLLRECGAEVKVVLTDSAQKFVTPLTLQVLSQNNVFTSLWEGQQGEMQHIDLARWADVILVAPATANIISKLALGLADDLLSTEVLAFESTSQNCFIAPAMNPAMFKNPVIQENLSKLKSRGWVQIGPEWGETACGEEGEGRLVEPIELVQKVGLCFSSKDRQKKPNLLISLGPTRSFLDPVRYLTNRSSGLMGASLTWQAALQGYPVSVVAGPSDVHLPPEPFCKVFRVETTEEMKAKVLSLWCEERPTFYLSVAAVLDWGFSKKVSSKIKKGKKEIHPDFILQPDILSEVVKQQAQGQYVLGFSAETDHHLSHGKSKLKSKGVDAIFINDVLSQDVGFESEDNQGWLLFADESQEVEFKKQSKVNLARRILEAIEIHRLKKLKKLGTSIENTITSETITHDRSL